MYKFFVQSLYAYKEQTGYGIRKVILLIGCKIIPKLGDYPLVKQVLMEMEYIARASENAGQTVFYNPNAIME